jgi:sulfoquinovosidase
MRHDKLDSVLHQWYVRDMGGESLRSDARFDATQTPTARLRWGVVALVLAAIVIAALPGLARASSTIGPERIVVQAAAAGAVIERAPFSIAFTDASGQTVLSEAPDQDTGFTLPPPAPGMPSEATGPALYAPLTFLVGSDQPTTDTGGQFVGNLLSDEEAGTEYSAQEVLAAAPAGEGVKLTVSTDDPAGRQLTVTIAPDGGGAIRVAASPTDPTGVAAMADSFTSSAHEAFHGFGGRHDSLDQHGQDFYNWVDQENVGEGAQESPGETTLSPDGREASYYVQSSFVSNENYGFLLSQNELSRWRMDSEQPNAWQSEVAAPELDYVVAPGSMPQAIATLTSITGRQRVPPTWALGPMFDREVELFQGSSEYEQKIESDLREITTDHLPVEAYRIEGWGFLSKPFLESTIARLRALGIRPLVYFRPFVANENLGTEYSTEYNTALADGYVATTASGHPFVFADNFANAAALIDFTNPAAVNWWRGRIDAALELGAEGFMLDFGEQVQTGMHFSDGATGAQLHNSYPVLVQRVTREAVETFEASHPGRSIVFFTRSGYSGEPGSAAYENFNFPGDETTNWSQASGLGSLTRDMLNRAIGGAFGYGTDVGGYYDLGGVEPTTRELFLRWTEWAALSPVFRLHGAITEEHAPWAPTIDAVGLYKRYSELHISAESYLSGLWQQADESGMPITRPLYLAYPDDPQAAKQDQEWLLGPDVLVAPVVERAATSRTIYFPVGCWRDPESGQEVVGPRYETVPANVEQLPFFFQCGTQPFDPPEGFAAGQTYTKALAVTTTGLPAGRVGSGYSQTLIADGGVAPLKWSISAGTLPAGLHLNGATGAIVGTPSAPGTSTLTVEVTDSGTPTPATATANLSISVLAAAEGAAEYGRCVAQSKGEYADANCQDKSAKAKKGAYEWVSAPAPICVRQKRGEYRKGCTAKAPRAGKGQYETVSFPRYTVNAGLLRLQTEVGVVTCTAGTGNGEITGAKTGVETITFTGCELDGRPCASEGPNGAPSGRQGAISTNRLATRLVGPIAGQVWTELESEQHYPYLAEFSCEGPQLRIIGSASGVDAGDVNVPALTSTTTFPSGEGEGALYSELSSSGGATWVGPEPASAAVTESSAAASQIEIRTGSG